MIARDAGRAASPPPPPPPTGPSFLRRHPLLAGFGVLAALSLFAAYWPASAIVTGVVVAARASGADRAALSLLQRSARRVLNRVRNGPGDGSDPPNAPEPTPEPTPEPVSPGRTAASLSPTAALDRGESTPVRRTRTRRPRAAREATRHGVEL